MIQTEDIGHEMLHAGYLALENMNYFGKKNRDFFAKVETKPPC